MNTLSDDPFFMSIFGMVTYFTFQCWIQTYGKKLTVKQWFNKNLIQFLAGALTAYAMTNYDDEILEGVNEFRENDVILPEVAYLAGGIWLNILYYLFLNIGKLSQYIVRKFLPKK
jgi:hypothetical protein